MDKRVGVLLAIAGLSASALVGMAGAAPATDEPRHLGGSPAVLEQGESPLISPASDGAGAQQSTEIELRGDAASIRDAVEATDGVVLGESPGAVHARVPEGALDALAADPGVRSVGLAPRLVPAVTSQGVATTGAAAWQGAGTDGTGIDVAVVDGGFAGYLDAVVAGELPTVPAVVPVFGACADGELTEHGTGVAEIVHDMAPGATVHLICVDSALDIDQASDPVMAYLRTNDIEVANASFGINVLSRGDGQGALDRAVTQSRRDGTLWTVSAGNGAGTHSRVPKGASQQRIEDAVSGFFVDAVDLNPAAGTDRWMGFVVGPGDGDDETAEAFVEAKWDSWSASSRVDFDIFAFTQPVLSEATFVTGSIGDQLGGGVPPIEGFGLSNPSGVARMFYLLIDAWQPTVAPIDLYFEGAVGSIEYPLPAGSVSEPGSSPGAFTVGAACVHNGSLEPFSSQGPTIDGRVKPDIVAPDGTSSSVYGTGTNCADGFLGTSAAAPHVAGAAALLLDANTGLDPAELQATLERRATPAGPAGKDSQWGWGRLALGAPGTPTAPAGDLYTGLSPSARLVDTRIANQPILSGATRRLVVAGTNGVPPTATAVILNVAAVRPTAAGYITTFPAGAARPVASSLNFTAGSVVANSVTVGLGQSGAVDLFNYSGTTHVVVDIAGWYGPTATTGLESIAPVRAVDTRAGKPTRIVVPGGSFGGPEVLTVHLAGNAAIPEVPGTASAVVLNAAVIQPTKSGHLTVWPTGVAKPTASNINFKAGATVANVVVAKVGSGGQVNVATNGGSAHAVLDVVGYYDTAAPGRFVALPTVYRIADSRTGNGGPVQPIGPAQQRQVEATSLYSVPLDATGVVLNVTAIAPTASTGHLAVWGSGPVPTASTLNFTKGAVVGNGAIVGIGPSGVLSPGRIGIHNSAGATNFVVDLSGYFVDGP